MPSYLCVEVEYDALFMLSYLCMGIDPETGRCVVEAGTRIYFYPWVCMYACLPPAVFPALPTPVTDTDKTAATNVVPPRSASVLFQPSVPQPGLVCATMNTQNPICKCFAVQRLYNDPRRDASLSAADL